MQPAAMDLACTCDRPPAALPWTSRRPLTDQAVTRPRQAASRSPAASRESPPRAGSNSAAGLLFRGQVHQRYIAGPREVYDLR
jgi:hypothetical protein